MGNKLKVGDILKVIDTEGYDFITKNKVYIVLEAFGDVFKIKSDSGDNRYYNYNSGNFKLFNSKASKVLYGK